MTHPGSLPAVVLAGGAARRLGGDKAFRLLGERPLIDHVVSRLRSQCAPLAISANDDPTRYADFGVEVLQDPLPPGLGPLAGLLAGLDWAAATGYSAVLTAPVDAPFLPLDLATRLAAGRVPAVAASGGDELVRVHPTCGLWPAAARDRLRAALLGGVRKVGVWAQEQRARTVLWPDAPRDPFFNINTPEDLRRAETLLG